jgi:anaerobic glycerol-3-phosphate dehydrogenase C subunit
MLHLDRLKETIEGEILDDELSRALYGSGACLYRVRPSAIVRPKTNSDVVRVLEYAARSGLSITARGGGTSRTGNELGAGLILDFLTHMNGILEFDPDRKWIRAQPGIVLSALNEFLKPHNLSFPVDPSTKEFCTLGGMIANNSSGPHAVKYGTTRDYVLSLEVVLGNGEIITTGPVTLTDEEVASRGPFKTLRQTIYGKIPDILARYRHALKEERPRTTKDSSGYHLWRVKKDQRLDLTPLLVGSEGTLAVVVSAKLQLVPIQAQALGGHLYFADLANVGEAIQRILALSPAMVEIMERRILDLARAQREEVRPYLPEGTEALLDVEFQGDDLETLQQRFAELEKSVVSEGKLAVALRVAESKQDMEMFAKLRSISGPLLNKTSGPARPVAFIEDAAVHPSRLPEYIKGLRACFARHGVKAGIYGHAGDGNLHTMVFLDLNQEDQVDKMVTIAEEVYDLVLKLKGTVSGEHGDGRTRSHYLKRQYPRLYSAFAEIKALFDPRNTLNPGIIVTADDNPLPQHLKSGPHEHVTPVGAFSEIESLESDLAACSGCAKCRAYCPIARELSEEWATGRGKIILLREVFSGHLEPETLETQAFKKILDSCINCKRCLKECPSGVDIPWLSVTGRAHYVKERGETLGNRLLTSPRALCEALGPLVGLANLANRLRPTRQLMEKTLGLDHRRKLPALQGQSFRKNLKAAAQPRGEQQIVLFLDCYSNLNGGEGRAAFEILGANGFEVLLPDLRCCGVARINTGAIEKVLTDIHFNSDLLADYVAEGLDIVFSEPSCALAVKMEYPRILNNETSRQVAEHCYDIFEYLSLLRDRGKLRLAFRKQNLTVGYHNPCHLRALDGGGQVVEHLRQIPGLRVQAFSDICCGLGGTFGLKKENFDLSMAIGETLFQEIRDSHVDEVVTSCGACAMQIFQGTGYRPIHPLSLLAKASKGGPEQVVGKEGTIRCP